MATSLFSHISGDINEQVYYILFIFNLLNIDKVEAQGVFISVVVYREDTGSWKTE